MLRDLDKHDTLIELVRHSCGALQTMKNDALGKHFLLCAELADRIQAKRLVRTHRWNQMNNLLHLIEQDINS